MQGVTSIQGTSAIVAAYVNAPDNPVPAAPQPPTQVSPFTAAHNTEGMYTDAKFDTEYITDLGVMVLPVGVEGEPGIVVQRSSRNGKKIVQWTVERLNAKPLVPSPYTQDPNEILVDEVVYPANPIQAFNGTVWRISGVYTYHLKLPKMAAMPGYQYPVGAPSCEVATPLERVYEYSDFDPKPLDCSQLKDQTSNKQILLNQVISSSP